jgi:hypothetical protein
MRCYTTAFIKLQLSFVHYLSQRGVNRVSASKYIRDYHTAVEPLIGKTNVFTKLCYWLINMKRGNWQRGNYLVGNL